MPADLLASRVTARLVVSLNSLGVEIVAFLKPQSAIINSTLGSPESEGDAGQQASATDVSVSAASYAGGFVGAMANSYAVKRCDRQPLDER